MTDATIAVTSPRKRRISLRKRNAQHQKAWRGRQKERYEAALALLAQYADDDPIIVTGADYDQP